MIPSHFASSVLTRVQIVAARRARRLNIGHRVDDIIDRSMIRLCIIEFDAEKSTPDNPEQGWLRLAGGVTKKMAYTILKQEIRSRTTYDDSSLVDHPAHDHIADSLPPDPGRMQLSMEESILDYIRESRMLWGTRYAESRSEGRAAWRDFRPKCANIYANRAGLYGILSESTEAQLLVPVARKFLGLSTDEIRVGLGRTKMAIDKASSRFRKAIELRSDREFAAMALAD